MTAKQSARCETGGSHNGTRESGSENLWDFKLVGATRDPGSDKSAADL